MVRMERLGGRRSALEATYQATADLLQRLRFAKASESVVVTPFGTKGAMFLKLSKKMKPKSRRVLSGHTARVSDLHWGEGDLLVSCARDGLMHLWHGPTAQIVHSWKAPGSWNMTCALEGGVVAVGGLDTVVSIYLVPDAASEADLEPGATGADGTAEADVTLEGHGGYVSCVRFLESGDVVTASGDASCGLWDAAHAVLKSRFWDHSKETAMTLSIFPLVCA